MSIIDTQHSVLVDQASPSSLSSQAVEHSYIGSVRREDSLVNLVPNLRLTSQHEFCWRWSFMYSGVTFDLKNVPAKIMMQSCKFFPPQRRRNGGGCGNNLRKVNAMTMMTTTTADADAYANTPQLLQQQQQLLQQQWRNSKRLGVSTPKDHCGTGFGYVGRKQRPGNGSNDDCGGIVLAAGKCGGDPGRAALSPLPPPPSPPRDRLLRGGNGLGGPAARRGAGPKHGNQG
jgi:hypothetical protein